MFPKNPKSLCRVGGRKENQDCVYPEPEQLTGENRLFIVCDGVGGAAKGEVASGMVCSRFPVHLKARGNNQPMPADFQKVLYRVSEEMGDYTHGDPAAAGMATTFTMVHLGNEKITIGWCGDSRVYLVRQAKILYHTFDHSLVAEMVRRGELTWEEARTHPRNNVITRSVNAETVAKAEFKVFPFAEIQHDDYLMLCTDGVLEAFDNITLAKLMDGKNDPSKVAAAIDEKCRWFSNDNYSLTVFQLKNGND